MTHNWNLYTKSTNKKVPCVFPSTLKGAFRSDLHLLAVVGCSWRLHFLISMKNGLGKQNPQEFAWGWWVIHKADCYLELLGDIFGWDFFWKSSGSSIICAGVKSFLIKQKLLWNQLLTSCWSQSKAPTHGAKEHKHCFLFSKRSQNDYLCRNFFFENCRSKGLPFWALKKPSLFVEKSCVQKNISRLWGKPAGILAFALKKNGDLVTGDKKVNIHLGNSAFETVIQSFIIDSPIDSISCSTKTCLKRPRAAPYSKVVTW